MIDDNKRPVQPWHSTAMSRFGGQSAGQSAQEQTLTDEELAALYEAWLPYAGPLEPVIQQVRALLAEVELLRRLAARTDALLVANADDLARMQSRIEELAIDNEHLREIAWAMSTAHVVMVTGGDAMDPTCPFCFGEERLDMPEHPLDGQFIHGADCRVLLARALLDKEKAAP